MALRMPSVGLVWVSLKRLMLMWCRGLGIGDWGLGWIRIPNPQSPELPPQLGHPQHRARRVFTRMPLPPARARQRLLHVVHGQHAEAAGDTRVERDAGDSRGRLAAYVVVVVGLAADHGADAGHAAVAAGLGAVLGEERKLVRARHLVHVHGAARLL